MILSESDGAAVEAEGMTRQLWSLQDGRGAVRWRECIEVPDDDGKG